jgi:hypothetical protein
MHCDFGNNIFVNAINEYQGRGGMQKNEERMENTYRHTPENYLFQLFYMCMIA